MKPYAFSCLFVQNFKTMGMKKRLKSLLKLTGTAITINANHQFIISHHNN